MLQNSPLYSYIPAKDVARARRFGNVELANAADSENRQDVTEAGVVVEI